MTDKITLPMDVSKGIQFDFTVEGITDEQATKLFEQILDTVSNMGLTVVGSYFSVAHMEGLELEKELDSKGWGKYELDLLDMIDDDISLDDVEDWENDFDDEDFGYSV